MQNEEDFINAINTVLTGVQMAQKRGAYTLEESSILYESIKKITSSFEKTPPQAAPNTPPEPLDDEE